MPACDWPDPARFPLNLDDVAICDVVLGDLKNTERPLIVAGYGSLDKPVEFIAASRADSIRIVFGSEPHEGQQQRYRVGKARLPAEVPEATTRVACRACLQPRFSASMRDAVIRGSNCFWICHCLSISA